MNTVQERLSMLTIHSKSRNLKALARVLDINPQVLYDIRNGKTKEFSSRLISKIFLTFPEINEVWLTTGEGKMVVKEEKKEEKDVTPGDLSQQYHLIETIYSQQETIARLTAIISSQLQVEPLKKEIVG